jgi:ribonuclease J
MPKPALPVTPTPPAPLVRIKPASRRNVPSQSGSKSLKVIALGGLREIGKNMFVLEYGDDMIIIDCGLGFPEEDMPGIDVVIPDMSYVFQRKTKLRGIFFTHGHEDHIGAVSWLLREVQAPLFGSKLTLALINLKLEDRGGTPKQIDMHPVQDGDIINAGVFSVEFIHTNHSIADANLLAIRTPVGVVVHTGDFKVDYTPINGDPINIPRIASIGQENPLLLLCESTNVEKPGFSMSESKVGESFMDIFEKAQGRIFVATFSSNIYRMQQIFTAAERFNRKVCLVGRSIVNVFQVANSLGYMTMKPGTLVDVNQIRSIPPEQLVIISTGSQGEPMSALTRIAFSEHQKIEIHAGDTVIISASPIPGNEKPIYRVINELFLKGADVIYASLAEVHASGHAYQEELKLMHQLVRPKYFVPIHGEYRMLYQHMLLAQKMGVPKDNSFLLCNGDILELTPNSAKVTGYVPADGVLIDGSSMGDIGNLVLRERKLLSDDGVISVSIAVDRETGLLMGEPNIQARGFIYETEAERIIEDSKNKIHLFIKKCSTSNKPLIPMIKSNALRDQLRDFLFDRTRRRPIVIVSLIEL